MSQQFCTFHVDGHFFGVEVDKVQEVVRQQQLTPVPLAPPEVSGLINLRGQIVTTIDLRIRLGLPRRATGVEAMNVLMAGKDGVVSLQVDQIGDVVDVDPATIEAPPPTLGGNLRQFIRAVSKQQGRLLLVLDESRAMDLAA